jgi:hypothetical protein
MSTTYVHVAELVGDCTLVHSSHSGSERRIAMTGARPDDSLPKCPGIIRSVRLAAGRAIRQLPNEMNAAGAISGSSTLSRYRVKEPGLRLKSDVKLFSKSVPFLLTGTAFSSSDDVIRKESFIGR